MIKEACVENFTNVPQKIARGATRIELCDNLSVGGTTVSYGVMAVTKAYCDKYNIPIMAIIRPRGNDFVYTEEEFQMMKIDIELAKKLGISGIVIGALTTNDWIDEPLVEAIISLAEGMEITFHMAFDHIAESRQYEAIDWLAERGIKRILTHGNAMTNPIEENLERLKSYIAYADNRIIILPGGGVNSENVEYLANQLNISEFHGTKIV